MLPLTATVGMGSLVTGWLVSRTGRVSIFSSIGQTAAAFSLVGVAFGARSVGNTFGPWGVPAMLAVVAVFQGSAMPVAQLTMQVLAPPAMPGAASASVQLSRSIGSAVGVTVATTMLFAVDRPRPRGTRGRPSPRPQTLSAPPGTSRAAADMLFEGGFTTAFLTVAGFAMLNAIFARTSPLRKL